MPVKRRGSELPHLTGKGSVLQKVVNMVPAFVRFSVPIVKVLNQTNVYANTIGSIWMVKEGQYGKRISGTGYLWDIPSTSTGFYANRV